MMHNTLAPQSIKPRKLQLATQFYLILLYPVQHCHTQTSVPAISIHPFPWAQTSPKKILFAHQTFTRALKGNFDSLPAVPNLLPAIRVATRGGAPCRPCPACPAPCPYTCATAPRSAPQTRRESLRSGRAWGLRRPKVVMYLPAGERIFRVGLQIDERLLAPIPLRTSRFGGRKRSGTAVASGYSCCLQTINVGEPALRQGIE